MKRGICGLSRNSKANPLKVFGILCKSAMKKCANAICQRNGPLVQSSDGASIGIANPALTRSMMTIVLKPLMSEFS